MRRVVPGLGRFEAQTLRRIAVGPRRGPFSFSNMHLATDDFELFGLPRRFAIDRAELDARRRALQAEVHPDRFVGADAASRRAAM